MLNDAEPTYGTTTVPVMPPLDNQCQERATDSLPSLLVALLAHPEFVEGVQASQEFYFDMYDEAPLTEEEMLQAVETNLSRHIMLSGRHAAAVMGWNPPCYLRDVGWVVGTIAKGLTYQEVQ